MATSAGFFQPPRVALPMIDVCYGVGGVSGQPGCIRYSAVMKISKDGSEETVTNWALEKLLAINPVNKSLSYEIVDRWTEKGLTEFYGSALQRMAERMEAALSTQGA
ncbi:uncharacterized protein LOC108957172 [Eucalyptus grandis]|uniref:uncharacterized protein LOC108957172 n=1 Tax=Eucalyptus grandis TaxID=71139 RepID=UPI00192F0915|nr:uncharacterized protein LOC108957172 [Eucalyptus grandis]